jgi:N6-L-threonylcarbamoyladenine synthase
MLVLGIESTCDETACSIVRDGKEILSNVVASQHEVHSQYGGVFPEMASRAHIDAIIPVIDKALREASVSLSEIDLVAIAHGPGLLGSILVGLNSAKALSLALQKPLIGINHVEAHLYAAMMSCETPPPFPCVGLVLSGAHTSLLRIEKIGCYELIGHTHDDAIGEAFDKCAKMMDLPYPGGPLIEKLAHEGNPSRHPFKAGKIKGRPLDFSFSGIKTSVLYAINGQNNASKAVLSKSDKCDVAASFQRAVFQDVIGKTLKAAELSKSKAILFGGGVTNNMRLRKMFREAVPDFELFWPASGLSLDNAAMIAGLGYHQFIHRGKSDLLFLDAETRIPLASYP